MGKTLDGYPTWNQNADPDAKLGADPYAASDCGEECCAIVQYGSGKGYVSETQVRQAMPGHEMHGETSGDDIASYLSTVGVPASRIAISTNALEVSVKVGIAQGLPSILLGYWVSPTTLHWVVAIGYGNDHLIYLDPWDGRQKCLHWKAARLLYAGTLVQVRE